ncbi:hypothetical protein D3C84_1033590 [compost metagenome]
MLAKHTIIEAIQQIELWRAKMLQKRRVEMDHHVLIALFFGLKIGPMQLIAMHNQQVAVLKRIHLLFDKIMNVPRKEEVDFIVILMLMKV